MIDAVIVGIRYCSSACFPELSAELETLVQDGLELRSESKQKRKRRDDLRVAVARMQCSIVSAAASALEQDRDALVSRFQRYITGTRSHLEMETDSTGSYLPNLKLYFCQFIKSLAERVQSMET
jgi:hypothetical protein